TPRHHATHAWAGVPASKLRFTDSAHARRPAWIGLLRASGRACSSSRANKMAKKLMAGNHSGAPRGARSGPDGPSGRQETVQVAQHAGRRAPDEARAAVVLVGDREPL